MSTAGLPAAPLAGRRILLVGMGFYDYEAAIAAAFRSLGAEVTVEDERSPLERGTKAVLWRHVSGRAAPGRARHFAAIQARAASVAFDHVVVINGKLLDEPLLRALRRSQPGAQFVLYLWDSLTRFPALLAHRALYDRVLTFDPADAARVPGLLLRPTFYRPEIGAARSASPTVDLCFVGWLHHDRLRQVEAARAQAQALGLTSFFYLYTGPRTAVALWSKGRARDVHVRSLPFAGYARHVAAARVLIDLPHPDQMGLTMRACDAVGSGRKLLTTATRVGDYDFYDPANVALIDAAAPRINADFVRSAPVPLPERITSRYAVSAWALDVLGVTEPPPFVRREPGGSA